MTTTIKIKTNTIKALLLLTVMNVTFACSNEKSNATKTDATTQAVPTTETNMELITINGTVKKITFGKDGYIADVQTDADGIYAALVSISNLGGPDNYKTCEVGDVVSFKGVPSSSSDAKSLMVKEIISIGSTDTQMLISSTGFRGIQVGDAISKHNSDYVKKTKMKTGEGTFEVYQIRDFENNPAGYFMADPNNKLLVGDITVESPKASTEKGIKLGSTFKDLLAAYPKLEAHGSEMESRTYAKFGNISYRLDVANTQYDLDKTKIPATAKIIEIVINRVVKK
jgi:hypothetical protein